MSTQTSRSHLLAIDDDAALRDLYADLFADVGFQVTVAGPPVTVGDIRSLAPDLILLDWPSPWAAPPALLRTMRQTADLATMPTIVTTTAPDRASFALPEDPCLRLVVKPFTVEQILDCADLLLAQARDLTRRSHRLRQQLGQAHDRQGQVLSRWTPPDEIA